MSGAKLKPRPLAGLRVPEGVSDPSQIYGLTIGDLVQYDGSDDREWTVTAVYIDDFGSVFGLLGRDGVVKREVDELYLHPVKRRAA